jgi:hypothetical protein
MLSLDSMDIAALSSSLIAPESCLPISGALTTVTRSLLIFFPAASTSFLRPFPESFPAAFLPDELAALSILCLLLELGPPEFIDDDEDLRFTVRAVESFELDRGAAPRMSRLPENPGKWSGVRFLGWVGIPI